MVGVSSPFQRGKLMGSWITLWFQQTLNANVFWFLTLALLSKLSLSPRKPLWISFSTTTQLYDMYSLFPTADASLNTWVNSVLENKITNFEYIRKVFSEISRWIVLSKEEFCVFYLKKNAQHWLVKSSYCSCRGPECSPQNPGQVTHNYL